MYNSCTDLLERVEILDLKVGRENASRLPVTNREQSPAVDSRLETVTTESGRYDGDGDKARGDRAKFSGEHCGRGSQETFSR